MRDEAIKNAAAAVRNGLAPEKITSDPEFKSLAQDPRFAGAAALSKDSVLK